MSSAASSAGAVFWIKGNLWVHWAVSMDWQQCFMNDGVLLSTLLDFSSAALFSGKNLTC